MDDSRSSILPHASKLSDFTNMIKYNKYGYLDYGIHQMTADEFIYTFCDQGNRNMYKSAVINIFDFAKEKGAKRIILGGSFLSTKEIPKDLDCMIVFYKDINIPSFVDCAQMDSIEYDILYASEETPQLIDSYIKLISTNEYGLEDKGIVEVKLDDRIHPWVVKFHPNEDEMEIIHRVYSQRTFIERNKRRGLLVVVHGLCTNAQWLSNLIPACNKQGWIVAPFIYDNPGTLLFSSDKRARVVEDFRNWIYALYRKYNLDNISIVSHSFGTYIITKYIEGFKHEEYLPVKIESLILTGGIINSSYDWHKNMPYKVGRVLNIVACGDDAVKHMPKANWKKLVGMDNLFGQCAIKGFDHQSDKVVNRSLEILTHTNIFKDDFIEQIMLPYLNVNNGIGTKEAFIAIRR